MKLGFVVNDVHTEKADYTTTDLAATALRMGHEAWTFGVGDFAYDADQSIRARAWSVPNGTYKTNEKYLNTLHGKNAVRERIAMKDLDVLLLRNDPSKEAADRPWAEAAGFLFAKRAMGAGVIVLNDPDGLSKAMSKLYFQDFPDVVRPRTLITREREEVKAFVRDEGGTAVLKPLSGSGGQSVFQVRPEDEPNLNQMIEAITRDGYVIAQEYLPAAADGDTRMFMMNGEPLRYKGKYAAFRRIRSGGDMRSNVHAGGKMGKAEIDDAALKIAEVIRPKLVMDGMFLVGLDIVGDKLMEINVNSPGGLVAAREFEGVNFARKVIETLERKVKYSTHYRRSSDNSVIAML